MKRKLAASLIVILIFSLFIEGCKQDKNSIQSKDEKLKIGDYIQFGKYNYTPIIWRIINIDKNGNLLLFSDKILCLKAFDSSGDYHRGNERRYHGSNYWKNSNVRQWLNSDKRDEKITWIQNEPSEENLSYSLHGLAPYEDEKGFLADGNFTENERRMIKPVTHKVLLADIDKDKKDGGEKGFGLESNISKILIENYDSSYYENIEDKVFLLSIKELYEYVWKNQKILGENYYIGKPQKEVIKHSSIVLSKVKHNEYWNYWLRSPATLDVFHPSIVRIVERNGAIFGNYANFSDVGVRPALYLNCSYIIIESGSGNNSKPYIIKNIEIK